MRRKKQIERICNNCKLYNPREGHCSVVILHEGQRVHLPVDPGDSCFYEGEYFDPTTKAMENFADELKEVKFWVENEDGQRTAGDGIVKMEYPEGFLGDESIHQEKEDDISSSTDEKSQTQT